jgi:sigma-54 dependent transcriptional regulator, acetoin dehydrogenase operon transcriptional activator AcoR
MNIKYSQKFPKKTLDQTRDNPTVAPSDGSCSVDYRINANVSQREVHLIITTLGRYKDIALASEALGVSRATFYRKCKAYGVTPGDYT